MSAIFRDHLVRLMVGISAMSLMAFVDYRKIAAFARPAVILSVLLLIVVLFVPQPGGMKTHRFITVPGFTFQPSELAKFVLILYFAVRMKEWSLDPFVTDKIQIYKGFGAVLVIMLALIYKEPNMSMVMLFLGISAVLLTLSGVPLKTLAMAGPGVGAVAFIGAWITGYQRERITTYFTGLADPQHANYHVYQSLIGVGNGGMSGVGIGASTQKHFYLPEPYKDFIFSIIGEEWGLVGSVFVLGLFIVLIARGYRIMRACKDEPLAYFLSAGITASIALSVVVNVGVTLGLLPATGQPLPFISYGGSSLIMSLGAIGVLLNVSRHMQAIQERAAINAGV